MGASDWSHKLAPSRPIELIDDRARTWCRSSRLMYGGQNSIVTLHLQAIWNLNSTKVGLVTLASVIPTLICMYLPSVYLRPCHLVPCSIDSPLLASPMVGWLADRKGNEWATAIGLILALPWWGLITIDVSLALFIVCFALESKSSASYETHIHSFILMLGTTD